MAQCQECRDEFLVGERDHDEVNPGRDDCTVCNEPACESHGRTYRDGWQHETCHNAPDYSRIED